MNQNLNNQKNSTAHEPKPSVSAKFHHFGLKIIH